MTTQDIAPSGTRRPPVGLGEAEAADRRRASPRERADTRSYASIVRANVFTVFNAILVSFAVVMFLFGEWQDALFLGVVVANSTIGIAQEVRAKRALDRLASLVAPTATVVRDGSSRRVPLDHVVTGDLVVLEPGDAVGADGELVEADALRLDESVLTGESEPVARRAGDTVRSGAFVVEGTGRCVVSAVGADSYAGRITGEARSFRHPRSPLERAINHLLVALVALMVPLALVLGAALWERDTSARQTANTATAAVVTLVPEGLVLLASLTFAAAAVRMARRGVLAQQLNAIESLASVDTLCLDKTGTLTRPDLRLVELVTPAGTVPDPVCDALARVAASSPVRNRTIEAIAQALPGTAEAPRATVPFSSRWRWSGVELDDGPYVLGAPELFELGELEGRATGEAGAGRRVVAFARARTPLAGLDPADGMPATEALALVVLAEQLRGDARETIAFFEREGVRLLVISGDSPATVGAIARDAGIGDGTALDGRALPEDDCELVALLEATPVVGRIAPEHKRRVVEALVGSGRYVAMVGDGVNDVPALKAARLAIAQGTGTQMAKAVADLVLVDGTFAAVPPMVAEGRQVLRNVQRVAKLFVSKSMFAAFLILSIGMTATAYPLLPRHLTLAASLTIGIPGFLLALAPSAGPWGSERFLRDVLRFAVPAGTAAGLAVLSSYQFALNVLDLPLREARSVATIALVLVGLYLVVALEGRGRLRTAGVASLCLVLLGCFAAVFAIDLTADFFALTFPGVAGAATAAVGASVAALGLAVTSDAFTPFRPA